MHLAVAAVVVRVRFAFAAEVLGRLILLLLLLLDLVVFIVEPFLGEIGLGDGVALSASALDL